MEKIVRPEKAQWPQLMQRPAIDRETLVQAVDEILRTVKSKGDDALYTYTQKFDGLDLNELRVSQAEIEAAEARLSPELKDAIRLAQGNIERFHRAQLVEAEVIETTTGVRCWRKSVPIEKVGLYIPGGSAPLFSTILMLGVPARIAGCREVVLCTPPGKNGAIHPAILYTAQGVGITRVFKVGGAQAVAAMAYGTESIPRVYKIFGPGNQYVTRAKERVQQTGVAIDMPAGPSELLVIADESCRPEFVAADLLSQAEHGPDSQVVLLTNDEEVAEKCLAQLQRQLADLPRREIAAQALANSRAIVLDSVADCVTFSNHYAPEHLVIASERAEAFAPKITDAGSVFLGNYSCESAGDYASGTNHTLPTNGYARSYSGVSLDSFVKKITYQHLSREGLRNLGPAIEAMAEAEGLAAHKNAVSIRLKALNDD